MSECNCNWESVYGQGNHNPDCPEWSCSLQEHDRLLNHIQSLTTKLEASEAANVELVTVILRANDILSERPNMNEDEITEWGVLADKALAIHKEARDG